MPEFTKQVVKFILNSRSDWLGGLYPSPLAVLPPCQPLPTATSLTVGACHSCCSHSIHIHTYLLMDTHNGYQTYPVLGSCSLGITFSITHCCPRKGWSHGSHWSSVLRTYTVHKSFTLTCPMQYLCSTVYSETYTIQILKHQAAPSVGWLKPCPGILAYTLGSFLTQVKQRSLPLQDSNYFFYYLLLLSDPITSSDNFASEWRNFQVKTHSLPCIKVRVLHK